jgi:hypothetical protein
MGIIVWLIVYVVIRGKIGELKDHFSGESMIGGMDYKRQRT